MYINIIIIILQHILLLYYTSCTCAEDYSTPLVGWSVRIYFFFQSLFIRRRRRLDAVRPVAYQISRTHNYKIIVMYAYMPIVWVSRGAPYYNRAFIFLSFKAHAHAFHPYLTRLRHTVDIVCTVTMITILRLSLFSRHTSNKEFTI